MSSIRLPSSRSLYGVVLLAILCGAGLRLVPGPDDFGDFVEDGFPFITTTVVADSVSPDLPQRNVAIRGLTFLLGDSAYAVFDTDLLRMAVGWRGAFLDLNTMAPVSYSRADNKQNGIPRILGDPIFGTGVYPGWLPANGAFEDPRPQDLIRWR